MKIAVQSLEYLTSTLKKTWFHFIWALVSLPLAPKSKLVGKFLGYTVVFAGLGKEEWWPEYLKQLDHLMV